MNTTDENKRVIRRYFEEVVNTGNLDALAEFVAPNAVDHNAASDAVQGVEDFRQHLAAVRATYHDFHVTVEAIYADGDMVISRVTARGIHGGTFIGLEPSGKTVTITGINIDRLENGRIVEHWGEANTLGALFQMGAQIVRDTLLT